MRRAGNNSSNKGTVSATPRQLESLIRISEAFAKMKLSRFVDEQDVMMAFELIKDALKQSATDPSTGMIDMDVIVTGQTSASRKRVGNILNLLKDLFQANPSDFIKKTTFEKVSEEIIKRWSSVAVENEFRPKDQEIRQALFKL